MQQSEYLALQRVEREHWFYKGKRALVLWWIAKLHGPIQSGEILVDAGAGTGEFVRELRSLPETSSGTITGIEYEAEARRIGKEINGIELQDGSILQLPFLNRSVDIVLALDVLEHVEDDNLALSELIRVTKPGGLVIVNVPAFPVLWSSWDTSLGHYRRYTKRSFRKLLGAVPSSIHTSVHYLEYINSFGFLPILLYRLLGKVFTFPSRAEDKIPGSGLNELLHKLFVIPATKLWFKPPFGTSIFCVLRKEEEK